jgi:hypothetical protein
MVARARAALIQVGGRSKLMNGRGIALVGATILACIGLSPAGCGSGSSGAPTGTISSVPTTPPRGAPAGGKADEASKTRSHHSPATRSKLRIKPPKNQKDFQRAVQHVAESLPPDKRANLVKKSAPVVFSGFGFREPNVTIGAGGSSLRAVVSAKEACGGTSSTQALITSRMQKVAPFLQSVEITVDGTNQSLSDYVAHKCAGPRLSGGKGRVVVTQSGSGFATTRSFTVRSRRWTIEYVNNATFLSILVMKGETPSGGAISTVARGSGHRVVSGTGRFRLKVTSIGSWTIRVRDGA